MTEHASTVCAQRLPLGLLATFSSSDCTTAPCDPIALACRTLYMVPMKEGRLLAEDGSERPFRVMRDEASAERGGVGSHGGLTGLSGSGHGGPELFVLSLLSLGWLGADGGVEGVVGVLGGLLGGFGLADLLDGHGGVVVVEALASDAHTVTRGGHTASPSSGQFTSRNPWRTVGVVA